MITTLAGTEWLFPGDGRLALDAPLAGITAMGVATDNRGNYFISDLDNLAVMKVRPDGILSVFAGNGVSGFSGDGGPAVDAALFVPYAVAADPSGNVYILDGGRVRRVAPDGTISTIAGTSRQSFSGDGGPATSATLNQPQGIGLDKAGNIYIADTGNSRIRKISTDGIITTIAGNGHFDFSGDGGPATSASLDYPTGVAVDLAGSVYIADNQNYLIRKVAPDGIITTIAGNGFSTINGGPAIDSLIFPVGVAVDGSGSLLVADLFRPGVVKIDSAGILTYVAGNGTKGYSGDGGPGTSAQMNFPTGVAVDNTGTIYVADGGISRIRKIDPEGTISTVAGNGQFRTGGDGGPATSAALYLPTGMAFDGKGNVYLAEPQRNRVRKVSPDGTISAVAGIASPDAFSGDGGPAVDARLANPYGIEFDSAGNLYIADGLNNRIRRITSDGIIDTFAGTGQADSTGDGGPAIKAALYDPRYIAFDRAGNLYFSDGNNQIRKITRDGIISTVAGNGKAGFAGDAGPAASANLNNPYGIALDTAGNLYIGDYSNNRVRKVNAAGIISTVAGSGVRGFSGDGGLATAAALRNPAGIFVDSLGNLYIADEENYRIRKVTPDGVINTVAGNGRARYAGDGGPALNASLAVPTAVALDGRGNLFIADWFNNRIRVVLSNPPSFTSTPSALTLRGSSGGPVSAAQDVQLTGTVPGLLFNATASTADGADWLKVLNGNGSMPGSVQIATDPATLAAGTYRGMITITAPDSSPPVRTIPVTLTVDPPAPAKLSAKPDGLTFTLTQNSAAAIQTVTVSNGGGGSLDFGASAATTSGGAWLTVSPDNGSATAITSTTLSVTASPTGLSAGTYSGAVTIASAATGETISLPVTMTVSAIRQTIRLLQTGLTFTAVAGGGTAPRQSFDIQNIGQGGMSWSVSATTLSGGSNWLSVNPDSGSSTAGSTNTPQVDVTVDPSGLAPGEYYGRVQVSAPAADNSPQTLSIVLSVLPVGSNPGPIVQPAGLIFTGVAGGESPGSQNIFVSNLTPVPINFGSGRLTLDGNKWFVHLPTDATVTPDRATRIVVQPDLTGLDPGIYRGVLTLAFPGGVSRTVNLLFIVTGQNVLTSAKSFRSADPNCAPSKLAPVFTALAQGFTVAAGWPNAMGVRVVDDCGAPMASGSVVATFSNGDPPLVMAPSQAGNWSGTWQARSASAPQVTVTVQAELPDRKTKGTTQVTGGLRANQSLPVITPGAVVNTAGQVPQIPVAPGGLISILGSGLANGPASASSGLAPTELGGTSVLIAGQQMPLLNVSDSRIDAVLPYGVATNTLHQLIVQRGASTSVPEPVTVAAAQPAIFTKDKTGRGQGLIYAISGDGSQTLAEVATPAKAGDKIVIQCAGLGAIDQPVTAGTAAPESPAAQAVNPVSVTIGGVAAKVTFAGLMPGTIGLYQVKTSVPDGVASGDAAVVLSVAGQISPAVTMAIQ